ncbi:MAG: Lrp/AsnC family transcriptional regulator, partial [Gammaproteobacteria bacterium]|nr:Lrp/AsnC family transcriptional regulator [Gammaproteobacteria bacterium]
MSKNSCGYYGDAPKYREYQAVKDLWEKFSDRKAILENILNLVMIKLDECDIAILNLLQADARLSLAEVARQVGASRPTVTERIRRMEAKGVITGYHTQVDASAFGLTIFAFIRMAVSTASCERVVSVIRSIPEFEECHRITGEDSYLIKARARSMTHLESVLDKLTPYGKVTTSLVMSSPLEKR